MRNYRKVSDDRVRFYGRIQWYPANIGWNIDALEDHRVVKKGVRKVGACPRSDRSTE